MRLRTEDDPVVRAELLEVCAAEDEHRARLHTATWGPDPIEEEDNRDMSQSLAGAAVLYRAVAATERAVATGQPRTPASDPRIEQAAALLLDALATETHPGRRADLCDDLYEVVEPIVGGQAAESIAALTDIYEHLASCNPFC